MSEVRGLCLIYPLLWLSLASLSLATNNISKPGCPRRCGNVTIPYPFGIGYGRDGASCSLNENYNIFCNKTFNPPKPFLNNSNYIEVLEITIEGHMLAKSVVAATFYKQGKLVKSSPVYAKDTDLTEYPLVISDTKNKLFAIGCDDFAILDSVRASRGSNFSSGCIVGCSNVSAVTNGLCSGVGCCQTTIPNGLYNFTLKLGSFGNHTQVDDEDNPYGYAFIGDPISFDFKAADLSDPDFVNRTIDSVPVVLEWTVWDDYYYYLVVLGNINSSDDFNCEIASANSSTYACKNNSFCVKYDGPGGGYTCSCFRGYQGNPYHPRGCTDIDECADSTSNDCSETCINTPEGHNCSLNCINTPGGYNCSCPKGYHGDGWLNGTSCVRNSVPDHPKVVVNVSATLGSLLLPPICWWLYVVIKRRNAIKQKARNFRKNGGLLLQQRMSSDERIVERTYFFTVDELEKATDHFSESRILGQGGQGTVYKGMLGEGRLVAIKKSKTLKDSQQEDFINEVVIMSQIIHRSIVKFLGCCLESEVPLLVYEFIPNGTLFNHLHNLNEEFPITWRMRLQIASDLAGALAYLHSFSNVPILHRDIKSSNILLDDKYRAKLSDFGLSKNVAPDQTHVTTRVMGTFGYLDPEYFQTQQYTEKSDVYSFGVVLVELLTGQQAIRAVSEQDRSLVSWFLSHMENSQFLDIVDPQVLNEGSKEEVYTIADLAMRCLDQKGKRRPTMKEVLIVLEIGESHNFKLPETREVQMSPKVDEQVVSAAGTAKSSFHDNVATSSTSSMETRYSHSADMCV